MEVNGITILNEKQVSETDISAAKDDLRLKEACREFEQIFIKYLVDSMWSSVELMGDGFSSERAMWQDMLNNEIAKEISLGSGLGISDVIYQQISSSYISNAEESTI
jgi:peptidoglycan hydrolase FlgJ